MSTMSRGRLLLALLTLVAAAPASSETHGAVHHSVFFELNAAPGSPAEQAFLEQLAALASLPGVEDFEIVREVSDKNPFRFGATMRFADAAAYQAYNQHPDHVRFVEQVWVPGVANFQEIDWAALP